MRVGPYELLTLLGSGASGRVHRARHVGTGREVAVKILDFTASTPAETAKRRERFLREARAAARLAHRNVVLVHETGLQGDQGFLVMDVLAGGSLRERLGRGPLSEPEALALAEELARGVAHAHEQGIIHRDLKPENVLFGPSGEAKLADFGHARATEDERLTKTGEIPGTATYLSPEQVMGERATAASDVWALGAILHESITGEPPFQDDMLYGLAVKICEEAPGKLPAGRARKIVLRALEKDPAKRYPTAAAFAEACARARAPSRSASRALGVGVAILLGATGVGAWLFRAVPAAPHAPLAPHAPVASQAAGPSPLELLRAGRIADARAELERASPPTYETLDLLHEIEHAMLDPAHDVCTEMRARILAFARSRNEPENPYALEAQAEDLLDKGELAACSELLERARRARGGPWACAETFHGHLEARQARLDLAIADYTLALEHSRIPDDPGLLSTRATYHAEQGDRARALADLDRVLRRYPTHARALLSRATLELGAGEAEKAVADLDVAVASVPSSAKLWVERANAYQAHGNYPVALASAERSLALGPSAAAHAVCGLALRKLGRGDESLAAYERSLALEPTYYLALMGKSGVYCERRDFVRAKEALDAAIAANPGEPELFLNRAYVHYMRGELAPAAEDGMRGKKLYEAAGLAVPDHYQQILIRVGVH